MKLSVVILNYNVRYFLELCLRSVEAALKEIDAEIIVVDNKSSDDSCNMVKRLFPSVYLIENSENFGFSKGNNIGVTKAKGEYICILNPDTVVAKDTFTKVLAFAESKTNFGILGCQLIDGRGLFLPESKRHIPTTKVAFQKLLGHGKNYYDDSLQPGDTGETEVLVGAFMLIQRSVYEKVQGFDEDYFMYGEDIDLSYRVLKSGYKNYYFGQTTIVHFKGESTFKDKIYAKRFYGAMDLFYRKHFAGNTVMAALVKFGLKLASLRGNQKTSDPVNIESSIVVTDTIFNGLKAKLGHPITFSKDVIDLPVETQVIFDDAFIDYKSIIQVMQQRKDTKQNTYRILVKSSNFILGSDSNINKGEVVNLD